MKRDQEERLFQTLSRYADIPVGEQRKLGVKLRSQELKKNDYFIRQGGQNRRIAFIVSGLFRVYCIDESGSDKTLAFRDQGRLLAAYSPFIQKKDVWYSIQALTDAEIIYFEFAELISLMGQHPCWETLEKNYIIELFIEKEDRERSFLLEDAATRYTHFCKRYPDIEKKVSQFYIASYLGISPVSLSRIRNRLKKLGPVNIG